MARRLSRRDFLRRAAAGAGLGLAAPYLTTTRVFAGTGKASPTDQVGIGHIGIGGMGGGHLGSYCQNERFPSVAVCDVDEGHRARAAARCAKKVSQHKDFRELLERPEVDAVVVATPDHWHALPCIHAMQAGKDVYCEKPLSLTVEEGRAMAQAARRYAAVFQVGSQQRSADNFRRGCELVRSGRIGKLLTVNVGVWGPSQPCTLPGGQPVPPGLDWEMWLGPAPWRPYNKALHPYSWRPYREFSGGANTNWGCHHVDIAQWGIGADATGPVLIEPPNRDHSGALFTYANGVLCYMGGRPGNGIRFIGTDGWVEVNRGHFATWPPQLKDEQVDAGEVRLYDSRDHRRNWMDCIWSRERPIADVEIGHRTATACHLANIAYWLNRTLRWDPAKEEIVGDPEASRWLSRPMRAPWHLPLV